MEYDIYKALAIGKHIESTIYDDDGFYELEDLNEEEANDLIFDLIEELCSK